MNGASIVRELPADLSKELKTFCKIIEADPLEFAVEVLAFYIKEVSELGRLDELVVTCRDFPSEDVEKRVKRRAEAYDMRKYREHMAQAQKEVAAA